MAAEETPLFMFGIVLAICATFTHTQERRMCGMANIFNPHVYGVP